jgi:hypothetical protein
VVLFAFAVAAFGMFGFADDLRELAAGWTLAAILHRHRAT